MKIYVAHSSSFDYQQELYKPLSDSQLNKDHELILPHLNSTDQFSSKELFQNGCDLIVAEVSYPSTGLGIELGWADIYNIPILFLCREDKRPSGAISVLNGKMEKYNDPSQIPEIVSKNL